MGTGRVRRAARSDSPDYRRGYLCGLIRGDGTSARTRTTRPDGRRHRPSLPPCAGRSRGAAPSAASTWRRLEIADAASSSFATAVGHRPMRAISHLSRATASRRSSELIALASQAPTSTGARASWPASSTPRAAHGGGGSCGSRTPTPRSSTGPPTAFGSLGSQYVVEDRRHDQRPEVRAPPRRPAGAAALLPHRATRRSPASARSTAPRSRATRRLKVVVDRAARDGLPPLRHHHRHRRLHRQRRGQPQLLRPPHPHLPRLRRRPGLRARDRRQGQHAGGRRGRS